jgi:hypothetical protein
LVEPQIAHAPLPGPMRKRSVPVAMTRDVSLLIRPCATF